MQPKRLLVTGGAGFIGSAFIRYALKNALKAEQVVNLDLLTYAADLKHLKEIENDRRYLFVQGDIRDGRLVEELLRKHAIDTLVHFAAETHVDRSIEAPPLFYDTNIGGTIALLEAVRRVQGVRFHQISTDEVFGSLGWEGVFTERSPYAPNSPYAASKAGADHFVFAYARTYGLTLTLSYCSNNYGPCQNREKLIPKMIRCCLEEACIPLYGKGENVRDWLFVEDHVHAVWLILEKGVLGESYAIGGGEELSNLSLAHLVIREVARQTGKSEAALKRLVTFVEDRPGHDLRYAVDPAKMKNKLGFTPRVFFDEGLQRTVFWYLNQFCYAQR